MGSVVVVLEVDCGWMIWVGGVWHLVGGQWYLYWWGRFVPDGVSIGGTRTVNCVVFVEGVSEWCLVVCWL